MSQRNWLAWVERLRVRGILLAALLILGGWGSLTAIVDVARAISTYRQSLTVISWAQTTNQLFLMTQHFAFERGRTAVVLNKPQPISDANRDFIAQRRELADQAMHAFLLDRWKLPDIGQERLVRQWDAIQALRAEVDRNVDLPLEQRAPLLVRRWYESATGLLAESRQATQLLVRDYVGNGGLELARLTLLAGYAFELRLVLGDESSRIAQSLAQGKRPDTSTINAIHEARGRERMIWQEIDRLHRYAPLPRLETAIEEARKAHYEGLQPTQDSVLKAWANDSPPEVALASLTASSQPALDNISTLAQLATTEIARLALGYKEEALRALTRNLVIGLGLLAIMLAAVWYVVRKVVTPLEHLDRNLRRLVHPDVEIPQGNRNEIVCLREVVDLVERLWKEKARLEEELRNFAFQDSLTGLPNRRLLMERLQQACIKNERRKLHAALLFLDLDRFKQVNDSHGHEIGDRLLVAVSDRLRKLLREEDTIARLGGDEFVVLIENLGDDEETAHTRIAGLGEKLSHALSEPYTFDALDLNCSASVGYKIFQGCSKDPQALMHAADIAMYRSKKARQNSRGTNVKRPPDRPT